MWKKYPGKTESPGDGLDLAYCFNFIYFVYLLQFHASGSTVIGGERTDPPVFAEAGSRVRSGCTMADRTYCAQMCSFY